MKKRSPVTKFIKPALLIILFSLVGLLLIGSFAFYVLSSNLPDPSQLSTKAPNQSAKIFDRTGNTLLYEVHGNENRTVVSFDAIPEIVKKATLAAEDSGFYSHPAISARGVLRAVIKNILSFQLSEGGSTITQQLAKNAFLTPERSITRKMKEVILAFKIEREYSKDQILGFYLNQIPYGSDAYGIEAASQTFFGKDVQNVSLNEAATLAALPRATTYYINHQNELNARKNYVLARMADLKWISQDDYAHAKNETVKISLNPTNIKAPHFVMYVRELLEEKYGADIIEKSGWKITTTLNWDLEKQAEKIVEQHALENAKNFKAANAALLAEDPRNGDILAMVGSRNYFDTKIDGNFNVTTALRQPGSSIKPFVYLAAMEKGYTPETIVFDLPTEFNPTCSSNPQNNIAKAGTDGNPCYSPENYDKKYLGPVALRDALAQSRNVPSVKVLYLVGMNKALEVANTMGISTLTDPNRYGLTLVLGGGEVRMTDMVKAYSTLSQDGALRDQRAILKIQDANGNVIEDNSGENIGKQVIDPENVRKINNILSDDSARTPLFGPNSLMNIDGWHTAAKSGTTDNYWDTWVFGYNPDLVVGVWAGNNYNTAANLGVSGLRVVPIWHEFMIYALPKENIPQDLNFTAPQPSTANKIMLNGSYLAIDANGNPNVHDILYWVDKDNPLGPQPENPQSNSQFTNWEVPVSNWVQQNYDTLLTAAISIKNNPGTAYFNFNNASASSTNINIDIKSPENGTFINSNQLSIEAIITAADTIDNIAILWNNAVIDQYTNLPDKQFSLKKVFSLPSVQNQNELLIVAQTKNGKTSKKVLIFK